MQVMQETWIISLGQENPLEKEMAGHSSILSGEIPWRVQSGGVQSIGPQRFIHNCLCIQHTHTKALNIVSEAKVDVFLDVSCFLLHPKNVHNLISVSSASSKASLYIWKFSVHVLLKTSLKDFEQNLTSMQNELKCATV